jgi:hypothetical protein
MILTIPKRAFKRCRYLQRREVSCATDKWLALDSGQEGAATARRSYVPALPVSASNSVTEGGGNQAEDIMC